MADEGDAAVHVGGTIADRAVGLVFALVVVGTLAVWFRLTTPTWFFLDEWALAGRGQSPGDFLEPYNGHLSVTYIAVYRAHMELFGFDSYAVLRIIGLFALASGPVLLYATTRRSIGAAPAAIAAIAVLWSAGVSLEPGAMNHSAVVACSIVAAWAVGSRSAHADRWLAGALTLGFLTAGGMAATAVGLVVHAALTRAPRRRWLAILVPSGLWAAWYVVQDRVPIPEEHRVDLGEALALVPRGYMATIEGLAGGSRIGGLVLLVVLVALAVRQVRVHGRPALVSLVSWNAAAIAWWLGLAQSRQELADPEAFRYRLVCSVFIVLSLVPPAVAAAATVPGARWRSGWRVLVPAAAVAGVALALVAVNLDSTRDGASTLEAHGRSARLLALLTFAEPAVVELGPERIEGLGSQLQADLVELRDRYGPPGVPAGLLDAELVRGGAVSFVVARAPEGADCVPADVVEDPPGSIVVRAGDEPVELLVRRFGDEPVLVTTLPAGSTRAISTAPLVGDDPWVLHLAGACVFEP